MKETYRKAARWSAAWLIITAMFAIMSMLSVTSSATATGDISLSLVSAITLTALAGLNCATMVNSLLLYHEALQKEIAKQSMSRLGY